MQKYIRLCNDAKVRDSVATLSENSNVKSVFGPFTLFVKSVFSFLMVCVWQIKVDTVLVEHDAIAKAIVELIAIHKITTLVMGMKRLPNSRYYFCCLVSFKIQGLNRQFLFLFFSNRQFHAVELKLADEIGVRRKEKT